MLLAHLHQLARLVKVKIDRMIHRFVIALQDTMITDPILTVYYAHTHALRALSTVRIAMVRAQPIV